jgi:hypothetical protein
MATAEQQKKGRDSKRLRVSLSQNVDALSACGSVWLAKITEEILYKIRTAKQLKLEMNFDFLTIREGWE